MNKSKISERYEKETLSDVANKIDPRHYHIPEYTRIIYKTKPYSRLPECSPWRKPVIKE